MIVREDNSGVAWGVGLEHSIEIRVSIETRWSAEADCVSLTLDLVVECPSFRVQKNAVYRRREKRFLNSRNLEP